MVGKIYMENSVIDNKGLVSENLSVNGKLLGQIINMRK
jgi:hypothetical protein